MKKFLSKFETTFETPQSNFVGKMFQIGKFSVTVEDTIAEGDF